LGGSVHTIKKNTGPSVVASKEIEIDSNSDKTKCMVMSRDQNAPRRDKIKSNSSSFERVEQFKYLGTTLTNHISVQE